MAFSHFHRHSRKYLLFFFVATLFTMFTFNISGALVAWTSSLFGGTGGAYVVFKTSSGKQVGIEDQSWAATHAELPGALYVFGGTAMFNPYAGITNENDLVLAHHILLAEAGEMKIEVPPERADELITSFKEFLQSDMQRQQPSAILTKAMWDGAVRRLRLTEERLKERLLELLKVEAYVRAVKGVHVLDPERMVQLFVARNVRIGVDYVEFPYEKYKAELLASPPADADLETWFKALPATDVARNYTREPRFSIDMVLVDADAWDPKTVPAELLATPAELQDADILTEAQRDPKRYAPTGGGMGPAKVEDLTDDTRAKVRKDKLLKATLEKLRSEFDAAIGALPPLSPEPAKLPDGTVDAEATAKHAAEHVARTAEEKKLFADLVAKYGLTVTTHEDQEQKALADIDPPKSRTLQYQVPGLATAGKIGLRTQQSMPGGGENKWAYVVRLVDAPKPAEPKPFAEVKDKVLEQWVDDHAKERALAKATEFRDALLAHAETLLPADVKAAFQAERDADIQRREGDLKEGPKDELTEEQKKSVREGAQAHYYFNVQSALDGAAGAEFAKIAKSLGLEVKSTTPQRRSVAGSDYYNDRFSGAERFLFRQDAQRVARGGGAQHALLGFDVGMASDVLENDAEKTAYMAAIASRQVPTVADMTPKDRKEFEDAEEREWMSLDRSGQMPAYANPFSISQLMLRHHPQMRTTSAQPQGGGGYGYY